MSLSFDPLQVLPEEISFKLFSKLEKHHLAACCQVNKNWRRVGNDGRLWAKIAAQMLNGTVPNVPNIKTYLGELESQKVKSNEKIIDRLQAFIDRISLGQNARFRCLISTGPGYQTISVEIKGTTNKIAQIPNTPSAFQGSLTAFDFKDDCIAINGIGNGSLIGPQPPKYQPRSVSLSQVAGMGESIIVCTIPLHGPFQAVLRFPQILHTDNKTDMERTITNMVQIKLDELASQVVRKNAIMYTAAGVAALSAYFLNSYFSDQYMGEF